MRRLRRRLARQYELLRWCNATADRRQAGLQQVVSLSRSLGFQGQLDRDVLKRDLPPKISTDKAVLHAQVTQQRTGKLKTWKESLLHEPGALARWLKKREAPQVARLTKDNEVADTPAAGAAMIAELSGVLARLRHSLIPSAYMRCTMRQRLLPTNASKMSITTQKDSTEVPIGPVKAVPPEWQPKASKHQTW